MKMFLYLVMGILLSGSLFSADKSVRLQSLSEDIIRKEIIKNSCTLTEEEARAAAKEFLKMENISVASFSAAASMMKKLIEGLRLVVEKNELPDAVFSKLNLAQYGVGKDNWHFYVSRYTTAEKIDSLEKWIPDNSEIIIESACKQLKPMMEYFLLERYIIHDFNLKNADKQSISDTQKIILWWTSELDNYDLNSRDKNNIIPFLVQSPYSKRQCKLLKSILKRKLRTMNQEEWK